MWPTGAQASGVGGILKDRAVSGSQERARAMRYSDDARRASATRRLSPSIGMARGTSGGVDLPQRLWE